jgi:hypothetical protein
MQILAYILHYLCIIDALFMHVMHISCIFIAYLLHMPAAWTLSVRKSEELHRSLPRLGCSLQRQRLLLLLPLLLWQILPPRPRGDRSDAV